LSPPSNDLPPRFELSLKTLNVHWKPGSLELDDELEVDEEGFCVVAFLLDASSAFLATFSALLSALLAPPISTVLYYITYSKLYKLI